jgi:hypothetical protein
MKWLDNIFAKIWWSLHPDKAAQGRAMFAEARLEYLRQITRAIRELAPLVYPPEKAKAEIAIAEGRLRKAVEIEYGLAELKAEIRRP